LRVPKAAKGRLANRHEAGRRDAGQSGRDGRASNFNGTARPPALFQRTIPFGIIAKKTRLCGTASLFVEFHFL
jgi:hypothetical protein